MSVRVDAKGKIYTDIVHKDEIPALIQTLTNLIHGHIFVRPGVRIKDEFNTSSDRFIAVTDAQIFRGDGELLAKSDFLTINKEHIVWIRPEPVPEEDEPDSEAAPST
jgi:hypothetical protein